MRRLSSGLIIPVICLAACQPVTVPLEKTVEFTNAGIKVPEFNNGQIEKNNDQTELKEENQNVAKIGLPRSIIIVDEPNETQNPYPNQPLKNTDSFQQVDQKSLEQKETTAEIAAANAVMNSITWQFQAEKKETEILAPVVPRDQDVSMGEDALETAFAMLSSRATTGMGEPAFKIPPKLDGVVRVGVLVPLSGKYEALGNEIRRSVEMALFTVNNPRIELLFLDTKAGEDAGIAAMTGIKRGVDIFIGPLFTDAVIKARSVMADVVNEYQPADAVIVE